MVELSKEETLNTNGGLLLTPLLTTKIVMNLVKTCIKLRFK